MMIGESVAIIAVLLVVAFMGVRAGRKGIAKIIVPFLAVPVCMLVGEAFLFYFRIGAGISNSHVRLVAAMIGAALGGAASIATARITLPQKARVPFVVGCLIVIVLMALAYVVPIL